MISTSTKRTTRLVADHNGFCSIFGIKASIIIVGFLLLVGILALIYLSAWTILTKHKYALLASAYLYTTSNYLLLFSAMTTLVTIITVFIAAWIEHERVLKLTLFMLILTLVFEISACLLAFAYKVNLDERLSKNLLETIEQKYQSDKGATKALDKMQQQFSCCGSKSFKDWQLNPNFNNSMASAVPDSCCKSYEPQCAQKPYGKHPSNIFYEGCSSALHNFFHTNLITLGSVTGGVALFQILTTILLVWLIKRIGTLAAFDQSITPAIKPRRLSNEITYFPIQSSVK